MVVGTLYALRRSRRVPARALASTAKKQPAKGDVHVSRAKWTSALFAGEISGASASEAERSFSAKIGQKKSVKFWINPFKRCALPDERCDEQDERCGINQVGIYR